MFPDFTQLSQTADELGSAANDMRDGVRTIESLLAEQNALLAFLLLILWRANGTGGGIDGQTLARINDIARRLDG